MTCVLNWENNESQPATRFLPAIIRFLGYNPMPLADSLMANFRRMRTSLGLNQEKLAQKLAIDESTIAGWERGENRPTGPYRKLVADFVASGGILPDEISTGDLRNGFSARKLISARKAVGISRAALARKFGISPHTLWRWERGDRKPHGLYRKLANDFIRKRDTPVST